MLHLVLSVQTLFANITKILQVLLHLLHCSDRTVVSDSVRAVGGGPRRPAVHEWDERREHSQTAGPGGDRLWCRARRWGLRRRRRVRLRPFLFIASRGARAHECSHAGPRRARPAHLLAAAHSARYVHCHILLTGDWRLTV